MPSFVTTYQQKCKMLSFNFGSPPCIYGGA